jgi:hypothetical protein
VAPRPRRGEQRATSREAPSHGPRSHSPAGRS